MSQRSLKLDVFLRVVMDVILVTLAYFLAQGVLVGLSALKGSLPELIWPKILLHWGFLTGFGIAIFAISGFYTRGRAYRSKYKAILIFQAVSAQYLFYIFFNYLLSAQLPTLPRTVALVGWVATMFFVGGARLYSALWRQVVLREARVFGNQDTHKKPKRILVIGGAGYIGSILCRRLLARGYQVRVLDALLYGDDAIRDLIDQNKIEFIEGDSRNIIAVSQAIKDMEAVVHLGEIVGDPATALDEQMTREINIAATRMIAQVSKGYGVKRFIYASSCSVYGASEQTLDEQSQLNPVSLYAKAKIEAEQTLLKLNDDLFNPIILRFATVYGDSYRPRFDLVVNLLTAKAIKEGDITIFGGDQWRPFVHVADISQAIISSIEAPLQNVKGEVFNVGSKNQNMTIDQLGHFIQKLIPEAKVTYHGDDADKRNYRVSFDKIEKVLGFDPEFDLEKGIKEVAEAVRSGRVKDYNDAKHSNFKILHEDNYRTSLSKIKINELSQKSEGGDPSSPELRAI